jgi:Rad3-related DNA helicase
MTSLNHLERDRQIVNLPAMDWRNHFPWDLYPKALLIQVGALDVIAARNGPLTVELPTGSGKTAIGYTFLSMLEAEGASPLFYIVPNKTLVDQVAQLHPDMTKVYGRNEYECLYYTEERVTAEESPCHMLDCPHRVDQETGKTVGKGVKPCPYYQAKFEARQSKIIVCTAAFYFFSQLGRDFPKAAGVVVDEAHQIAKIVRSIFSSEITDVHIERSIQLLEEAGAEEAGVLHEFLKRMRKAIKHRQSDHPELFSQDEIEGMLDVLSGIRTETLEAKVQKLMKQGKVDPITQRETLKRLEGLVRNLSRYGRSLQYAIAGDGREHPLNYVYGTYKKERDEGGKVQHRLFIKYYHASPIIRRALPRYTLSYSATIGDPEIFKFETGIRSDFHTFPSTFPVENTRIFMPTDTANLAVKSRSNREPTQSLRKIARACKSFSRSGLRSLVVVVSEKERQKFLLLAAEEGVQVVSYGNGVPARVAAQRFKEGEGDVLIGTIANYSEGVDFPKGIAPVTFFLRPGYPHPHDPQTLFEERRFGSQRWKVWNWRAMIESLQVRGRNVRSATDVGITIFMSQQFRRFLFATLPKWLEDAYDGDKTLDECVKDAKQILKTKVN